MEEAKLLKTNVYLKTGQVLHVVVAADRSFTAKSLTEDTVHSFVNLGKTRQYFVRGSNIAYVEVEQ